MSSPVEHMKDEVAQIKAVVSSAPVDPATMQCIQTVVAYAEVLVTAVEKFVEAAMLAEQRILHLEQERDHLRARLRRQALAYKSGGSR